MTIWAVAFVKASDAPGIWRVLCCGCAFCASDNNHSRVCWSWTVESALVDYLILVVVLVPSVYLFNSIAEVYVHNMQCHVRSCCLFLLLDQRIGYANRCIVAVLDEVKAYVWVPIFDFLAHQHCAHD